LALAVVPLILRPARIYRKVHSTGQAPQRPGLTSTRRQAVAARL